MELNPQDTRPPKKEEPFVPWESRERPRPPWVKDSVHYSETIPPWFEQKSNLKLTNEQVLQPRVEDIATSSSASPLAGRHSTGSGASDEPSGNKRTYQDATGGQRP